MHSENPIKLPGLQTSSLFSAVASERGLLSLFAVATVACPTLLTRANLFLAEHPLKTFEMKPIAEEEEEEEKVEVVKAPVAEPTFPEPPRSGTAVAFAIGAAPAAASAGTRRLEVMPCCRTEVSAFAVVLIAVKITLGFVL